jgi:uncharacterized membrane protein YfcA
MTSASLLVVLLVGTVVGAMTGLFVGDAMNPDFLAILAGFLGAIISALVRNFLLVRVTGVGPDDSRTPGTVILFAAVASLAAGLGAKEVADFSEVSSAIWIGTLAGLFSAILLAMLMIVYHTHPGHTPKLHARKR